MLNQLIYADIEANSSGGGAASSSYPPPPPNITGYDPYDEDGVHEDDYGPISSDVFLYGNSGSPLYSSILAVLVRWGFAMNKENLFPKAIINGKEVCGQHSPYHIVSYSIGKTSGSETIKMSLKSSGRDCKWNGGASCTYTATLRGVSVSKKGTCGGGATFRVSIKASGEVSIS